MGVLALEFHSRHNDIMFVVVWDHPSQDLQDYTPHRVYVMTQLRFDGSFIIVPVGFRQGHNQPGINPSHGTWFVRAEICCVVKLCQERGQPKVGNNGILVPLDQDIGTSKVSMADALVVQVQKS